MDEKKTDVSQFTNEVLIADLLIRLAAMEYLMVLKGMCTPDEIQEVNKSFAEKVTKEILNKAGVSNNLKEFITSLQGVKN